jgi:outer membrane protein
MIEQLMAAPRRALPTPQVGKLRVTPQSRRSGRTLLIGAILTMTGIAATGAQAQQAPVEVDEPSVRRGGEAGIGDWSVRLGAGAAFGPSYPGSRTIRATPIPVVEVAYRPGLPLLDTVFFNARDGLGVIALRQGPISIGGSVGYAAGRDQDLAARLQGMGDIEGAARASLFVRAEFGRFELSLQSFHAMGDQEGTVLTLGAAIRQPIAPGLLLVGRVEASWADADDMQQWFGVSAGQASRSRFAAYDAGAGLRQVSANLTGIYSITDHWSVTASVGVTELVGDAADSPITERVTQPYGLLGLTYRF